MTQSAVEAVLLLCDTVEVVLSLADAMGARIPLSTATELQRRAFELRKSVTPDEKIRGRTIDPTPAQVRARTKEIRKGRAC